MGRPLKKGLDFHSVDIDMDSDMKVIDILEDLGSIEGMGCVYYLLNEIYKNGYFMEASPISIKRFCRSKHLDRQIIDKAIGILTGSELSHTERIETPLFFNYRLYREEKILTSAGIQKRYLYACKQRTSVIVDRRYLLLESYEDIKTWYRRDGNKKIAYDRKGSWITFDSNTYAIEFVINGEIDVCTNTNKDSTNTNNDSTTTAKDSSTTSTDIIKKEILNEIDIKSETDIEKRNKKEKKKKEIKREDYPDLSVEQIKEVLSLQGIDSEIITEDQGVQSYTHYDGN